MDDQESENYVFKFVCIAIGVGILAENLLLLLTVAINKKLHTTTFTLIANLAVADMLAGLMFIFMYASGFEFDVQHKPTVRFLKYGGTVLTLTASACGLLAIDVDQYIEITSLTIQSRDNSKRVRRCVFAIILSWLVAIGLSIPPVLRWNCLHDELCSGNYNGLSLGLVIALESSILVATYVPYVLIYHTVCASTKRVTQQMGCAPLDVHMRRQARLQNSLTLVLGFFTACLLPFMILIFVDYVCASRELHDPFDLVIPIIALLNSAVNPLIYALRNKDVRSTYLYILCCCRPRPSQCCSRPASVGKARDATDGQTTPHTLFTQVTSADVITGDTVADNPQILSLSFYSEEANREKTALQ